MNNRLIKRGVIRVEGKNENGEDIYVITRKGERFADEKLRKRFL